MRQREITRRQILSAALISPLLPSAVLAQASPPSDRLDKQTLEQSRSLVVSVLNEDVSEIILDRTWREQIVTPVLENRGKRAIRIKEVILFDLPINLPPETRLYGEGFQMLSQTGGTLGQPIDLGNYTDEKHYKMPMVAGARTLYGVMTLAPPRGDQILMAFTRCDSFVGQ